MESFKTYQAVNSEKTNLNFGISKMQDIYQKRNGAIDEPHRHNYFTVLIIKKAKGLHKIDFTSYNLSERQIFFVAPGQIHQVIEEEQSQGFVMTFATQFLVENSIPLSFIDSLNLFQNYGETPPLILEESQFDLIENFSESIFQIFHSNANMKNLSIGSYLKLILIECNNICSTNPIDSENDNSGKNIIRAFKKYVDRDFRKEHSTSYYANLLAISADHLNRVVKTTIGKTAKEYIQTRIVTEAKRLIYFTELSNKEIGYELGFNEPANFSAFFKKHTDLSPSNFKKFEATS